MQFLITFIAAAIYVPHVTGHYFFPHFIANGNFTGYNDFVREDTQGFMPFKNGYTSTDLRCNTGSQSFASKTGVYKVRAGDEIGFGTDFGALIQHPGPMQVYLSKAPGDVREYDGSGDWFKIYELGPKTFSNEGIGWGVTNIGNFTFTLPKETPAGQYLVRIEHIGVHGAGEFGQAEFFFNCAQIEIESSSTAIPGPLVKIPGLYSGYELGILFYMYRPWIVNYTMPGPPVWPSATDSNITASGVSIAPTETPWILPAVTNSYYSPQSSISQSTTGSSTPASTKSSSTFIPDQPTASTTASWNISATSSMTSETTIVSTTAIVQTSSVSLGRSSSSPVTTLTSNFNSSHSDYHHQHDQHFQTIYTYVNNC